MRGILHVACSSTAISDLVCCKSLSNCEALHQESKGSEAVLTGNTGFEWKGLDFVYVRLSILLKQNA